MTPIGVGLVGFGYAGRVFHAPLITATPGLELECSGPQRAASETGYPDALVVPGSPGGGAPPGRGPGRHRDPEREPCAARGGGPPRGQARRGGQAVHHHARGSPRAHDPGIGRRPGPVRLPEPPLGQRFPRRSRGDRGWGAGRCGRGPVRDESLPPGDPGPLARARRPGIRRVVRSRRALGGSGPAALRPPGERGGGSADPAQRRNRRGLVPRFIELWTLPRDPVVQYARRGAGSAVPRSRHRGEPHQAGLGPAGGAAGERPQAGLSRMGCGPRPADHPPRRARGHPGDARSAR